MRESIRSLFFTKSIPASVWIFLVGILGIWAVVFQFARPYALGLVAICGLLVLVFRLWWGLYALILSGFFIGLEIDFGAYGWARDIPWLSQINLPAVDLIAVGLLAAIGVGLLVGQVSWRDLFESVPGVFWLIGFCAIALVSASFSPYYDIGASIRIVLRSVVFVYAAYVVSVIVLFRRYPQAFSASVQLLVWIAYATALFGLASLFLQTGGGWLRATPFALFGLAPLGWNHNLLAEVLVATWPLAWLLFVHGRKGLRPWYALGLVLVILIMLLTLSRAAWIAAGVQLLLLYRFRGTKGLGFRFPGMSKRIAMIVGSALFVCVLGYMTYFLTSNIVDASNDSRLDAVKVALFYVADRPFFGYGPGAYLPMLNDTFLYTLEYGIPLESHGFLQKILLETGVIGFVLFCGLLLSFFVRAWRAIGQAHGYHALLLQALFLGALGSVVFQFFNTSYFNSHMWLPLGLLLAGVARHKRHMSFV